MKKFLSLLLAAMMLLSCTTAMAATDTIENGNSSQWDSDPDKDVEAEIDVFDTVRYSDEGKYDESGKMATELWLQVDATGQIDATVPLVLVFQTNIDGGEATSPGTYKIMNNSSADLVVTEITSTIIEKSNTNQPMTMVAYDQALEEDQYKAQLATGDGVELGQYEIGEYDLSKSYVKDRLQGGLFALKKANADGNGTATPLSVTMKTGKLSFVTSRGKTEEGKDNGDMDLEKGVQLMTITYTVAIDTSDAIGEDILGADGKPLTAATDTDKMGEVVEVTNSGSGTVATEPAEGEDAAAINPKQDQTAEEENADDTPDEGENPDDEDNSDSNE